MRRPPSPSARHTSCSSRRRLWCTGGEASAAGQGGRRGQPALGSRQRHRATSQENPAGWQAAHGARPAGRQGVSRRQGSWPSIAAVPCRYHCKQERQAAARRVPAPDRFLCPASLGMTMVVTAVDVRGRATSRGSGGGSASSLLVEGAGPSGATPSTTGTAQAGGPAALRHVHAAAGDWSRAGSPRSDASHSPRMLSWPRAVGRPRHAGALAAPWQARTATNTARTAHPLAAAAGLSGHPPAGLA